jgi:Acetyltransferases, including N-acetylases of ribosomal proteins
MDAISLNTSFNITINERHILLRPYRPADISQHFEAVTQSIQHISEWLDWCHPDYTKEESTTWVLSREHNWNNGMEYNFAIIDPAENKLLGTCTLNNILKKDKIANLGYWTRFSEAGKGICSAAAKQVLLFGFNILKLNRIEIIAAVPNIASQKVAERIGAVYEGILRSRITVENKVYDAKLYAVIKSDL